MFVKGRAGRGVEVEESYMYGEGPEEGVVAEAYFYCGWTGNGCGGRRGVFH